MRYITERELRDSFSGGAPDSYEVPRDAKLTPAARQYLMDLRLFRPGARGNTASDGNRDASSARISRGETNNSDSGFTQKDAIVAASALTGRKPEHMTHLTRDKLVCKANARIELRGRLDSLEAEVILTRLEAPESFAAPLDDALALIRQTLASDVKEQPLPDWKLDGMTAEQIHRASHHPEEFGLSGHLMPDAAQGRFAALLNRLRTTTRECELCAVRAYWQGGVLERADAVLTLNRLSSYFYVLQLRAATAKE